MRLRSVLAPLAALAAVAALRRSVDVIEVRGRSMAPALLPGDRLVVARGRPRIGGVVLATDPRDPARELVKRVVGISAGGIELRGDNPVYSTDGRSFGAIDPAAVRWRAIARYWPPPRIGRVPAAIRRLDRVDEGGEPACAVPEALIAG